MVNNTGHNQSVPLLHGSGSVYVYVVLIIREILSQSWVKGYVEYIFCILSRKFVIKVVSLNLGQVCIKA
jgi:hypothetical protein